MAARLGLVLYFFEVLTVCLRLFFYTKFFGCLYPQIFLVENFAITHLTDSSWHIVFSYVYSLHALKILMCFFYSWKPKCLEIIQKFSMTDIVNQVLEITFQNLSMPCFESIFSKK